MFCKECGAQVADGDMFCAKCGTAVESEDEDSKSNRKRKLAASILGGIGGVCLLLGAIGYMMRGNSEPVSNTKQTQEISTTNQKAEKTWNEIGPNDILSEKHLRRFWQEFYEEECRNKKYGFSSSDRDKMINLLERHIQAGDKLTKTQVSQEISSVLEENERQKQAEFRRRQEEEEERQRLLNSPKIQLEHFIKNRAPIMKKVEQVREELTSKNIPKTVQRSNQAIAVLDELKAEHNKLTMPSAITGENAELLDTVMKLDRGYIAGLRRYHELLILEKNQQATARDRNEAEVIISHIIRPHRGPEVLLDLANRMGVNANIRY